VKNRYLDDLSNIDWWERLCFLLRAIKGPVAELVDGIKAKTIPVPRCIGFCLLIQAILFFRIDYYFVLKAGLSWLYPASFSRYYTYYFLLLGSPFWVWAVFQARKKQKLRRDLDETFQKVGLKNNLNHSPRFIFDKPLDGAVRKLRVSRAGLPLSEFNKHKEGINADLGFYIDEIRENREHQTVDIIYSTKEMHKVCKLYDYRSIPKSQFIVGITRSREVSANINAVPHFLIAGQTGGGKSTFLRHFITTLYLNDDSARFTIIDLKGSVESQLFENLRRIDVPQNMGEAIHYLEGISATLDYRLKLLKANQCKDIHDYFKLDETRRTGVPTEDSRVKPGLFRHIVIVDEVAEMFLAGTLGGASDIQKAKRILSRVARQGRSIGVHLVLATQRPDSRVLDPQIKANLPGVLCFQMVNDASSILVLGNGRATDLPPIPGRAIWKTGMEMLEVQTPYLDAEETENLLRNHYITVEPRVKNPQPDENTCVAKEPSDSTGILNEGMTE